MVMRFGEWRVSADIDLLVSDWSRYPELHRRVTEEGISALGALETLREGPSRPLWHPNPCRFPERTDQARDRPRRSDHLGPNFGRRTTYVACRHSRLLT
ncbi:hypothetical protein J8M97_16355 [Gordonia polyisoprenivorans]|nr:hypothetical protein J8M97_16355 [Gordonia polyisoprenivorans]